MQDASDPYLRGATRLSGTSVVVRPDSVTKTQAPVAAAVEFEKSSRAHDLGLATGLFSVPPVIEADLDAGRLVFRAVRGPARLEECLERGRASTAAMAGIGVALAAIHRGLLLPDALRAAIGGVGDGGGGPQAFLHGDFTAVNFFVEESTAHPTIFDWQTAGWLGGSGTWGPVSVDLAAFVISLFACRLHQRRRLRSAPRLARAFLDAYFTAAERVPDRELFARQSAALLARFRSWCRASGGTGEYLLHVPGLLLARRLLRDYAPPA